MNKLLASVAKMSKNRIVYDRVISLKSCYSHFTFKRFVSFLSPSMINKILQHNEYTYEPPQFGPVKRIFVNQLAANSPCEDRSLTSIVRQKHQINQVTNSINHDNYMFSVIDGHAGGNCADYIAHQLHQFLSAAFVKHSNDIYKQFTSDNQFDFHRILPTLNPDSETFQYNRKHLRSWQNWYNTMESSINDQAVLTACFEQLDLNLIDEVINENSTSKIHKSNRKSKFDSMIHAGSSGACCCTVTITGNQLNVASSGDCFAVLGKIRPSSKTLNRTTIAEAINLTVPHNYWNSKERERIENQHPNEDFAISSERLLACLLPFRAFGDMNFKLPLSKLSTLSRKYADILGTSFILPNYISPPYLTASPDTLSYDLSAESDQFILIASDGLSDMLSSQTAVTIVNQFLSVERALNPCVLVDHKDEALSFKLLSKELDSRADALARQKLLAAGGRAVVGVDDWVDENRTRPLPTDHIRHHSSNDSATYISNQITHCTDLVDQNAATHLLRHALSGGNPNGIDYSVLEYLLSHSNPRMVRDDITVIIVQLNNDYLDMYTNSTS